MNPHRALIALALAAGSLVACSPAPQAAAPAAAPTNTAAAAPAPARKVTMICRNSQTGAKAECGTPNAVMVGMKSD
jgi:hypothetical protein